MAKKKAYTPEFKASVVRELVEGDDSIGIVAARHDLNANMLSGWRKQLFDNAELVYSQDKQIKESKQIEENHGKEVDNLNRIIGQLTVERDYLQRRLGTELDRRGL